MKNYFTAFADIFRLNQLVFRKNFILFFLLLVPFLFIDHRAINIDYVDAYDVDEFFFLKVLYARQFYGFNHLDAQKFFSGFYSYGRLFWIINFLVTYIPFTFHKYNAALFITRVVSSLFAIQGLLIFKETLYKLTGKNSIALILSAVGVLMAYFWATGSWLHPDWLMMYFVLLAFYYFFNTNTVDQPQSQAFVIAIAIAVAVKVQSLQFVPLLVLYLSKPFFITPTVKTFVNAVKQNLIAAVVIVIMFVVLNPYLVHPKGPGMFYESFAKDMASNKTNNLAGYIPTFGDKALVFAEAYLSEWIVAITFVAACIFIIKNLRSFKADFEKYAFILSSAVLVVYYILFVNKAWPHYYLPIPFMVLLILCFAIPSIITSLRMQQAAFSLMIILQLINLGLHLDYFKNWIEPQRRLAATRTYELQNEIKGTLQKYPNIHTASVVFTYDLPIPVNACGLSFDKVYHSPELNLPELLHISRLDPQPADYVVIQKNTFYKPNSNEALPEYRSSVALIDSVKAGKVPDFNIADTTAHFIIIKRASKETAN